MLESNRGPCEKKKKISSEQSRFNCVKKPLEPFTNDTMLYGM